MLNEGEIGMLDEGEIDESWYNSDAATFGDRLTAARNACGMSQEDLVKRLGIKKKALVSWENDWSEPRANKLQMLSGMLSVSIGWLLTGEGELPKDLTVVGPDELNSILLDLRQTRQEHAQLGEKMGRLEKRLRSYVASEEMP